MNLTVLCKRIMGLFILLFVVSIVPVHAADKVKCENYLTNVKFVSRYNVNIEEENVSKGGTLYKYKLSVEPTSSDSSLQKALRKVVFKIVKINNTAQNGSQKVSYGKPIYLDGQFVKNAEGDQEMMVTLESTEENADPKCTGKVTFKVGMTKGGEAVITSEPIDPVQDEFGQTNGQAIDCTKPQSGAFEKAFCDAKNAAIAADPSGSKGLNYSNKFDGKKHFKDVVSGYKELKCDVTKLETKSDYYVNKTYLYGSGEDNLSFGHYTYHYSPGEATQGAAVKCKVKCEESLVVEYGPPVASKAGLCFEYKVKVTSRVSCSMSEKPVTPDTPGDYCTPTPLCKSSESSTVVTNQGGPNEEFDQCISECDGGRYTDKCTKKCYKKVYGKSNNKNKKTTTPGKEYLTERLTYAESAFSLNTCINESSFNGCYYRSGNSILWKGKSDSTPGRWYLVSPHKDLSEYGVFGNGIYRHIWSDGSYCHDICWWSGCSGSRTYLNPGMAAKDRENNKEIYDRAVAQCKATASCTTTTADFTISVNYKDGENHVKEINFPYTSSNNGEDHLTSKGASNGYQDTASSNNTTILNYSGCYKEKEAYRIYMTEWSFPGSWINNKTGEISYVNKNNNTAWQKMKNKFCIPLDAQNVNQKWWNYYYYFANPNKTNNNSTTSTAYQDKCVSGGYGYDQITTIKESDIEDWNIKARTKNFGYFGWNIKISCFYALNTNPTSTSPSTKSSDVPKSCVADASYRIRSVDLTNLFPASDGSSTSREPGFNWSEYATMTKTPEKAENNYYTINPSTYSEKVQKLGQGVYSDEYLDYSVDLTRSLISKLKNDNKALENNYTSFSGDTETNYVINYKSPLFRGGILSSSSKYPNEASLKCNNMKKYNGGCEE